MSRSTPKSVVLARILLLVGLTGVYIVLYLVIERLAGATVGMVVAVPVAIAAWWFGLRAGLVASVGAIALNWLLAAVTNDSGLTEAVSPIWRLIGYTVLLFFIVSLGLLHELSERLRRELALRQQAEQSEQRRSAELEAIYRASLQLSSSLELKPLLLNIVHQVTTLLDAQEVHIYLYDGASLSFGAAFWDGQPRDTALRVPRPDGFTATIARTGQRWIVSDISRAPIFKSRDWTGAVMGVPLSVAERVYGVMNVGFSEPHSFSESELRVVQLLADQAATALRNAGEFEGTRQHAESLEQRVVERTAELQRAKEGAEALANNSFDAILLLSAEGVIGQVNPAFNRIFGVEPGEGRAFASLFDDEAMIAEALSAIAADHDVRQIEATARRANGLFTADLVLAPLDGGEMICTLRDVSERKRAETQQRELTQGLRQVLALAYELISSPDIDTLWRHAVEAGRERLGLERCAIFVERDGFMWGTYGTDRSGQTTDERLQRWMTESTTWRQRSRLFAPDAPKWEVVVEDQGEWQESRRVVVGRGWIAYTPIHSAYRFIGVMVNDATISGAPLDEIKQEIVAMYCSLLGSLYEHKRVEDDVRRALEREKELNELKSRFTSMISHELRTPLASIQLSTDLLKRYTSQLDSEGSVRHLDKIQMQVRHLTSLLEDVLTFTSGEQVGLHLQRKRVDLRAFCADLSAEVRATNPTHEVVFADCPDGWLVSVDTKLMRQALMNLLLNAVKYSPEGSTVALSLTRDGHDAVIRVADQGIGIPESDLGRIFEVFYRATNVGAVSGTGLGLALVRQIAEAHHGFVFCESVVGVGTTFTLRIPVFA